MKTATQRSSAAPRLIAYVRVSTEEQAERGLSLAAQEDRLRAYAAAHGLELLRVEVDAGVSGKVPPAKRPSLARALADVRAGRADGIVATKLDRLSRTTRATLDLVEAAERQGWRLVSVTENLDTGTAAGRMVVTILAALAQMEREQVGERTATGMAQVAREGRARSRFLPFGFRVQGSDATVLSAGDHRQLVEDPGEQAILRRMLKLRTAGEGARRIRRALEDEGIWNPRTGAPWTLGSVAAILRTAERRAACIENCG